jgi:hypothetical protein
VNVFARRRRFLQGLGLGLGAHLLSPIAGKLLPEALGAATPARKRFILLTHGGGLLVEHYTCKQNAPGDLTLNPVMAPLEPYKKDLMVAAKLYCPHDRFLHGNGWSTTTMVPRMAGSTDDLWGRPPGGVSIDRLIAQQIGASDPFSGTLQAIAEGNGLFPAISSDGPGMVVPPIQSPVKAFATLFGKGLPGMPGGAAGPSPEKLLAQHKSILDGIRADVARLQGRLAPTEKAKLEQYLESLRGLERQLGQLPAPAAACTAVPAGPAANLDRASLDPDVIAAHVDVLFNAHLCGLTHVSHFTIHGNSSPHNHYSWLGDTRGFHDDHHAGDMPMIAKISSWVFTKVAQLAGKLAAAREGDGTMLDNSVVAFVNTCGGKHHGGHDTYSVITLGRAGGALRAGQLLNFPEKERSLSDAYVGIANALGVPIRSFGTPEHNKGPLPGMLA